MMNPDQVLSLDMTIRESPLEEIVSIIILLLLRVFSRSGACHLNCQTPA